ncbi:NASP-related protein sim3 [Cytospora mali]|uniref:NASP-related protein sim3 n=1 Tax=Cytospora mali TaxID=578113 RepID=A0A194W8N7_CYTMA|nr:NASP-related protein sim3 [Valsa mali]
MADEAAAAAAASSTPQPSGADTGTATPTLAPGTATGTATPQSAVSFPLNAEQRSLSLKVSLADLTARASALYTQKKYDEAAEVYAQAAEMQAEMNGEMSPDNAEILFLYGRSLFKVGQGKSDVLGGKAPAEGGAGKAKGAGKKGKGKKVANGAAVKKEGESASALEGGSGDTPEADRVAQEAVKIISDETSAGKTEKKEVEAKKPLFQFTGDENWDDSEEEEEDEETGEAAEGEEDEEEDDDLATAFEILDLARVLLRKQLDEKIASDATEGKGKEKAEDGDDDGSSPSDAGVRHIKERLADTHDLLAEISLENERYAFHTGNYRIASITDRHVIRNRYPNAIADARESLVYKQQLCSEDSEIIAEAHFKLSLALEFASVTSQQDEEGPAAGAEGPKEVSQELRDEAAKELEAAINSTKLKLQNKEVELATLHSPEDNEISRKQILETKEIIADMEQRLVDLRGPPIDMKAALGADPMGGILGAALGESNAETEARIEEAKKTATDLTGLVRKKEKKTAPAAEAGSSSASNGKRKAEEEGAAVEEGSKKARTEEESAA